MADKKEDMRIRLPVDTAQVGTVVAAVGDTTVQGIDPVPN